MADVEIGIGKSGRRAYGFDDIAIVPSRRTRDPEEVDIGWEIDAFRFELPDHGVAVRQRRVAGHRRRAGPPRRPRRAPPRGAVDPLRRPGARARGDRRPARREGHQPHAGALRASPCSPTSSGSASASSRPPGTPWRSPAPRSAPSAWRPTSCGPSPTCSSIQGTVVSAEHVSRQHEPLNLKDFIRHYEIPVVVGGCTSYQAALHLMRTGAAGVLVGAGSGAAGTTRRVLGVGIPMATAIADARAARMRHLDETGVYVHVIADGGMTTGGDIAKAIVCGADAVMVGTPLAAAVEAPGRGYHWGTTAVHATLPRGHRVAVEPRGTLEEILVGPAHEADGQRNLLGAPAPLDGAVRLRVASRTSRRPRWSPSHDARAGSPGPRRRLRRAVRPADRPTGARGAASTARSSRTRCRWRRCWPAGPSP